MKLTVAETNIIFIGNDIEARVVFGNALLNFYRTFSIAYFFDTVCACKSIMQCAARPDFVFINAGTDIKQCMEDIGSIKDCVKDADCSIVVYDTHAILANTIGIFSMGANAFVNKPYDFRALKKVLPAIVAPKKGNTTTDAYRYGI